MKILSIESSCDETAVAIASIENNKISIITETIASQINLHKQYGGVVPEVAAREHVLSILPTLKKTLLSNDLYNGQKPKIDAIAVTSGPGLITSLLVGVETARSLSYAWNIPLISLNHIEGHIAAAFIDTELSEIKFPLIALTVSGGHTMLILMTDFGKFKIIGETRDDAAGEAFDKAAKMMNIGYPGGPIISQEAKKAKPSNIKLPRPMIHSADYDFSFSGLKTALLYEIKKDSDWQNKIPEYCYEFQQAVVDVLVSKTIKAASKFEANTIVLAGGVAANESLRETLRKTISEKLPQTFFLMPELKYTTDNAAMVAAAGYFRTKQKAFTNWQKLQVDSNMKLID